MLQGQWCDEIGENKCRNKKRNIIETTFPDIAVGTENNKNEVVVHL